MAIKSTNKSKTKNTTENKTPYKIWVRFGNKNVVRPFTSAGFKTKKEATDYLQNNKNSLRVNEVYVVSKTKTGASRLFSKTKPIKSMTDREYTKAKFGKIKRAKADYGKYIEKDGKKYMRVGLVNKQQMEKTKNIRYGTHKKSYIFRKVRGEDKWTKYASIPSIKNK